MIWVYFNVTTFRAQSYKPWTIFPTVPKHAFLPCSHISALAQASLTEPPLLQQLCSSNFCLQTHMRAK